MGDAGLGFPDLDRIAVTVGPGSFTGVRVGIAAARGFALVTGCPVAGIGTLDAIAEAAREVAGRVPVMAVLDAKRDEVYAQAFDAEGQPLSEPAAGPAAEFAEALLEGMVLAGSGARLVAALAPRAGRIVHEPTAPDIRAVLRLGLAAPEPSGPPRPLYLRPPDAKPQAAAAVATPMIALLPSSRIFVEPVGDAEADSLAEIHGEGFPRPWLAQRFRGSGQAQRNVGALGLRRQSAFGFSRLVGFVLFRSAGDEAEILSIAVRRSHRGRGHGRLLMDEALRRLYRERIRTCFLEVDPDNAAAVSLYRSLGFAQVGSRKGYYDRPGAGSGTALVMRLELQ